MPLSKWLLPALLLIPAATPAQDLAQDTGNTQLYAEGLKANRRLSVGTELALKENQKEVFWPLYDEYYEKRMTIHNTMLNHVNHYADQYHALSDQQAVKLVDEHLVIEAELVTLHREYLDKLQTVLTPRQLMRFYQIDFRITAQTLADIAAIIPLAKLDAHE